MLLSRELRSAHEALSELRKKQEEIDDVLNVAARDDTDERRSQRLVPLVMSIVSLHSSLLLHRLPSPTWPVATDMEEEEKEANSE